MSAAGMKTDDVLDLIRETTVEHLGWAETFRTSSGAEKAAFQAGGLLRLLVADLLHRRNSLIFCDQPVNPCELKHQNNDGNPLTSQDYPHRDPPAPILD